MAATSNQITLDKTHIDALRQYYADLRSKFKEQRNTKYVNPYNVSQIQAEGVFIVRDLVYAVYQPRTYIRTYNLERSIQAADTSNKIASISLYSNPQIAEAELNPGFSYAAFFQEPIEFNTFIKPRGSVSIVNYRPFFQAWEKRMDEMTSKMADQATGDTLQELQPDILRKK